jgi:hypothetical protein
VWCGSALKSVIGLTDLWPRRALELLRGWDKAAMGSQCDVAGREKLRCVLRGLLAVFLLLAVMMMVVGWITGRMSLRS